MKIILLNAEKSALERSIAGGSLQQYFPGFRQQPDNGCWVLTLREGEVEAFQKLLALMSVISEIDSTLEASASNVTVSEDCPHWAVTRVFQAVFTAWKQIRT